MPFTTPDIRFDSLTDGSFLVLSIPLSFSLCINLAKLTAVPVRGDTRLDLVDSDYTGAELLGSQEEMDRGVGG